MVFVKYLGVLVDLHEPYSRGGGGGGSVSPPCGSLNVYSYQKLIAVEWATEIINNKSWPGEFSLGKILHQSLHAYVNTYVQALPKFIVFIHCMDLLLGRFKNGQ